MAAVYIIRFANDQLVKSSLTQVRHHGQTYADVRNDGRQTWPGDVRQTFFAIGPKKFVSQRAVFLIPAERMGRHIGVLLLTKSPLLGVYKTECINWSTN